MRRSALADLTIIALATLAGPAGIGNFAGAQSGAPAAAATNDLQRSYEIYNYNHCCPNIS